MCPIAKGDVYTIRLWFVYRGVATSPSLPRLKGLPRCGAFRAKIGTILGRLPYLVTLLYRDTSYMLLFVEMSYFNIKPNLSNKSSRVVSEIKSIA